MILAARLSLHAPHSTPRKTIYRTTIPKLSQRERCPIVSPRRTKSKPIQQITPVPSLSHLKIPHNFLTKNHDTPPSRLSHQQVRPTPLTRLPTNIFAHFFAKSRHNRPSFEKNAVTLNTKPTFLAQGAQNKEQKVILSDEGTTAEQGA